MNWQDRIPDFGRNGLLEPSRREIEQDFANALYQLDAVQRNWRGLLKRSKPGMTFADSPTPIAEPFNAHCRPLGEAA